MPTEPMKTKIVGGSFPPLDLEADKQNGRIIITVGGLEIDVHCTEDGVSVQLTHENEVLDEASADYPDAVNAQAGV